MDTQKTKASAFKQLPRGYEKILTLDLLKDKKKKLLVNGLSMLILLAMAIPMHFYISVGTIFDFEDGILQYLLRWGAIVVLSVVYIVLHELVHGIAMKRCGTKKVKYDFKGIYACAGSDDYYRRGSYIFIALAPVVLWGVVIGVVNCFVPTSWFWVVYFLQITNISGAAGDFYVTFKMLKLHRDILIRDSGTDMKVYSCRSF